MRYLPTLTFVLLSSTAFVVGPAKAEASLDELKARLDKAQKENLLLKAEKVEKENILIKTAALEAENAAIKNEMKPLKKISNSSEKVDNTKNKLTGEMHAKSLEAPNLHKEQTAEQSQSFKEVDEALASIPKGDQRRELAAISKAAFDPNPVNKWESFYAGVNLGYDFGTNQNSSSSAFGPNQYVGRQWTDPGPVVGAGPYNPVNNGASVYLANSAAAALNKIVFGEQNGFIAGGQIGYNKFVAKNIILGVEADIMGSAINGNHAADGLASSSTGYPSQPAAYRTGGDYYKGAEGRNFTSNALSQTTINAGVNWLGTVRGRFGGLITPDVLLYGTGGLTYGDVYAKVSQLASNTLNVTSLDVPAGEFGTPGRSAVQPGNGSGTFIGNSSINKILVGWNIGGGVEWSFEKNWSLKAEALYWNLGSTRFSTYSYGSTPIPPAQAPGAYTSTPSFTTGQVGVNYQGVIARAGLNYHFVPTAQPTVMAKY